MPIYQYSRTFWYPNGTLAAGIPVRVFPLNSPALAPLFTDATGSTPLSNPVTTNGAGVASFFAEEGEYWLHADAESFRVSVGSADVDLFEVTSSEMSTGIVSGGNITVNALNPAAVDIDALTGYVVDEITDPDNVSVVRVRAADQTVALDAPALARTITFWLLSSAGTVIQQATTPTPEQRRTHLVLGATGQAAGAIFEVQSSQVILAQPTNQLADLMDALGPFSVSGNAITVNANLTFNQGAGEVFSRSFNHFVGGLPTRNPHLKATQAQAPAQFRYITAAGLSFGPLLSNVEVANYDNAGVITPVGTLVSIQRLWLFATNTATNQLAFQYGNSTYSTLTNAIDAIGAAGHVPNPIVRTTGSLLAYFVVRGNATNLNDTSQARIIMASKFATP